MNLKIEDLEKNDNSKIKQSPTHQDYPQNTATNNSDFNKKDLDDISIDKISIESKNLILQSMKDALIHMIKNNETSDNFEISNNLNNKEFD